MPRAQKASLLARCGALGARAELSLVPSIPLELCGVAQLEHVSDLRLGAAPVLQQRLFDVLVVGLGARQERDRERPGTPRTMYADAGSSSRPAAAAGSTPSSRARVACVSPQKSLPGHLRAAQPG